MSILKEVTVEQEAMKAYFKEQQKERIVEVMAIRESIVELFDSKNNPGEGFTNKQILEWLISKGFKVNPRQIPAKMQMMKNVFYGFSRVNHKAAWKRRVCSVCQKPLQLGDKLEQVYAVQLPDNIPSVKHEGHTSCIGVLNNLWEEYAGKINELHTALLDMTNQRGLAVTENGKLLDEIKKLRSMIVFPSENDNKGTRRIEL